MYKKNIRLLRKVSQMTQDELAKLLNVKRHTVCDWESGRTEPNINNIKKIAEIFNVTVDFLVGYENKEYECHYKIISKYNVESMLEYQILANTLRMNASQQEKLLTIINSLKEFNK